MDFMSSQFDPKVLYELMLRAVCVIAQLEIKSVLAKAPAPGSAGFQLAERNPAGILFTNVLCYRTMLEIDPDSVQIHSNIGAALYHLGRPEEALRSIERALALNPDLETARTSLEQVRKVLRQAGQ